MSDERKALEETLNMLEKAMFSEGELSHDEADKWIDECRAKFNLEVPHGS